MTVFRHELRQGRLSLAVWILSIVFSPEVARLLMAPKRIR